MRGRGTIRQAIVQIPYLTASWFRHIGLHARDPLDVSLHAVSPDVGALMNSVNGKHQDIAGALDTTLHVTGTRVDPALSDTLALTSLRYGKQRSEGFRNDFGNGRTLRSNTDWCSFAAEASRCPVRIDRNRPAYRDRSADLPVLICAPAHKRRI